MYIYVGQMTRVGSVTFQAGELGAIPTNYIFHVQKSHNLPHTYSHKYLQQ